MAVARAKHTTERIGKVDLRQTQSKRERQIKRERQARAFRELLHLLDVESQTEMAKATGISNAAISRTANARTLMSSHNRLRLARYLGSQCRDEQAVDELLSRSGWTLSKEEWREARRHMMKSNTLTFGAPWLPETHLIERHQESAALRRRLLAPTKQGPHVVIVQGIAGIGKTTLANQAVRDRAVQERYGDGIYWLDLQRENQRSAILSLAQMLTGLDTLENRNPWQVAEAALKQKEALLVLDSASAGIQLDRWQTVIPRFGALLLTTRVKSLGTPDQRLSIPLMNEDEMKSLLTRGIDWDVSESQLSWLMEALGGLPLALDIVNHIARWDKGFTNLVEELQEESITPLRIGKTKDRNLERAFRSSYQRLDEQAAELFRATSRSPQPFEADAFAHILGRDRTATVRGFRTLTRMGLMDAEDAGRYRTHRLLHEYARLLATERDVPSIPTWNERFANHYLGVSQDASDLWNAGREPEAIERWRAVLPHIDQGFHYAAQLHRPDWVLAFLKSAYYYVGSRGYGDLLDGWRTELERVVSNGQAALEASLYLGDAYLLLGRPSDAAQAFGQAREVAVDAEDERHWLTATVGLTHALVADGALEEALATIRDERYSRSLSSLPDGDPLHVTALALAGVVRKMLGQYDAARSVFLEALSPVGSDDGKTHWPKIRLLLELGETLLALLDRKGALEVFEEGAALAEEKKYDSLWSRHSVNAIIVLARMGRVQDAKKKLALFRRAANQEPHLGSPIMGGYLALAEAEVLWTEGSRQQAEQAYREAAEAFAGTVTATDVWVLLAERLTEAGELGRAEQIWQRARESGRKTGHQYKHKLATLRQAELLWRKGHNEQARQLLGAAIDT